MEISRLLNMVKVTIALIVLICSAMMGQTHGSPMDEREAEFMRKYDSLSVYDRNLATWKTEYAAKIAAYKDKLYKSGTTEVDEAQMCDNTQELRDDIAEVETAITNKETGVKAKQDQLKQLQDILDHPDFDGITGLKDVLQGYVDTHKVENDADLVTLATEKTDVQTYKNQIDSYSCPCVWDEWGEWGALSDDVCTETCGGGFEYRRRTVFREPTNSGDSCSYLAQGDYLQQSDGSYIDKDFRDCNTDPCPVDCEWSTWTEWDMSADGCSKQCGPGERESTRYCTTSGRRDDCGGEHGGAPCDGNDVQTISCNVLVEAQALVSQQEELITKIQECASNCEEHTDCGSADVLPVKCA